MTGVPQVCPLFTELRYQVGKSQTGNQRDACCYFRILYRGPWNSDPEPVALLTPSEGHWTPTGRTTLGWGSHAAQGYPDECIYAECRFPFSWL